jgi:hypothetical protein
MSSERLYAAQGYGQQKAKYATKNVTYACTALHASATEYWDFPTPLRFVISAVVALAHPCALFQMIGLLQ